MTGNSYIDDGLVEISRGYRPGLLAWVKQQPGRWRQLLALEDRINGTSLAHDEEGLTAALQAYHLFFEEMTETYCEGDQGSLFNGDEK